MNISIVDLNKDIEELRKVAQNAFSTTPDSDLSDWFSFTEMIKAINENHAICLKAIDDNSHIVGIIYAQQESLINGKEGEEKWVIVLAAVDSQESGKGIGSMLLKKLENLLLQKGVLKIFVYTNQGDEKVINFYKKNEYQDAGWIKDYQYGKGNSAVFLIKYLK